MTLQSPLKSKELKKNKNLSALRFALYTRPKPEALAKLAVSMLNKVLAVLSYNTARRSTERPGQALLRILKFYTLSL